MQLILPEHFLRTCEPVNYSDGREILCEHFDRGPIDWSNSDCKKVLWWNNRALQKLVD